MLPPQIFDKLRTSDAAHAYGRLRLEDNLHDELTAESNALAQRAFDLMARREALQVELGTQERGYSGVVAAAGTEERPTSLFKRKPGDLVEKTASDYEIDRIREKLTEVNDQIDRLRVKQISAGARLRAFSHRLAECRRFLSAATALRFADPPAVNGQSFASAREQVNQLFADLREIAASPYPSKYAKERIKLWVDAQAHAPNVTPCLDEDADPYLPRQFWSGASLGAEAGVGVEAPDTVGVLFWAFGDQIKKLLCKQVDELCNGDQGALDPVERVERTAAIKKQILEAARIEEACAYGLLKDEQPIELRADETFDPRAMLGVAE
jgi:hypothetical protein